MWTSNQQARNEAPTLQTEDFIVLAGQGNGPRDVVKEDYGATVE